MMDFVELVEVVGGFGMLWLLLRGGREWEELLWGWMR